jgi:hypothetical protein
MRRYISLLLFIGLAWGQETNVYDSNFENQVTSKNNDNNSFFSDVSFSIHYARYYFSEYLRIHNEPRTNQSLYRHPHSYGFALVKPYKKYLIQLGLSSTDFKESHPHDWFSYMLADVSIKYFSLCLFRDYSSSFLNFSIINETRRYPSISIGLGSNIIFMHNIYNKIMEPSMSENGELRYLATLSNHPNMINLNHQIKGIIGLNIPLTDLITFKVSGNISNMIYPDYIEPDHPVLDTAYTDWDDELNKFILNEMKLNRSVQFELIFNLFGTQNKNTKIIKKKRKKVSKKNKTPKGFEDF